MMNEERQAREQLAADGTVRSKIVVDKNKPSSSSSSSSEAEAVVIVKKQEKKLDCERQREPPRMIRSVSSVAPYYTSPASCVNATSGGKRV